MKDAGRFAAEAEAQVIKIEAGGVYLYVLKAVSDAGMAVMTHIGIRPQSIVVKMGKFGTEAITTQMGLELISLAEQMANSGA